MTKNYRLIFISALITPLLLFVFLTAYAAEENIDISVIINNKAPQSNLSNGEIQKIFTGKTTMWSSNEKIIIAILKNNKIHDAFLKKYVKRNPAQFKNTWRQMVFTGKGDKPKKFDTIEGLIGFVSNNRTAIGYITKNAADGKIKMITP